MDTLAAAMPRVCLLLIVSSAAIANAEGLVQLERARAAIAELDYSDALKALDAAKKEPNLTVAETVSVLELQGVTLASLGQEAKALKVFQTLLSLAPEAKLAGNQPPRVTTVFFEARGWVDQKKPLHARPSAQPEGGSIATVSIEITNDPLKLAREVRFFLKGADAQRQLDVPLTGVRATVPVGSPTVEWFAVVLGERKAGLVEVGSVEKPMVDGSVAPPPPVTPPPVVVREPPPPRTSPTVVVVERPPPPTHTAPPMSGLRVAGIAVGVTGLVAVGVGSVFGVMAQATSAKLAGAERDGAGRIVGLTRVDALGLDAQQRFQATLANVLWIAGGAIAATGAGLFFLGGDDAAVAVTLAPAGVGVAGAF